MARRMSQTEVHTKLRRILDLKPLSFVAAEIVKLCSSAETQSRHLGSTILRDPALAARVLRMANSAFYAARGRSSTVSEAITRIGYRAVRDIAMTLALAGQFPIEAEKRLPINPIGLWKHNLACGVLARSLARPSMGIEPEEAFLSGLLHDVGKIVFNSYFPGPYEAVVAAARKARSSLDRFEQEMMGMSHAEVDQYLLEMWRIPSKVVNAVVLHSAPLESLSRLSRLDPKPAALVGLADIVARAADIGTSGDETLEDVPDAALVLLGLKADDLRRAIDGAEEQVLELTQIMLLDAGSAGEWDDRPRTAPCRRVRSIESQSAFNTVETYLRRRGHDVFAGEGRAAAVMIGPAEAHVAESLLRGCADSGDRAFALVRANGSDAPTGAGVFTAPFHLPGIAAFVEESDAA